MTKRFVRVVIVGLTNRGNLPEHNVPEYDFYTTVNIVQPTLNIEKLERTISGAEIVDYPYTELFNIYTGDNVNRVIYNDDDILSYTERFYIEKKAGETTCPYSVGQYLWLHEELVKVWDITGDTTSWSIFVNRGQAGTVAKFYIGLKNALKTDMFMYGNVFRTTRNSFSGIIVELRDPNSNELISPYVISGYGITDDVVSIQLDHILTTLNLEIPEEKILQNLNYRDIKDQKIPLSDVIYQALGLGAWNMQFALGFYEQTSSIIKYLDLNKFKLWIKQVSERYSLPSTEIKGQVSDMIRAIEILSHTFITWTKEDGADGYFKPTEFFIERYYFSDITEINLSDYRVETKVISKPAMPPSGMEIEFNNGKRKFSTRNIVAGGRSSAVSLKLNIDATEELTAGFRNAYDHIYSKLTDYAVAQIDIKVAPHLEDFFYSGRLFQITDIWKYNTFQKKGEEIFDKGFVLGTTDGICSILIAKLEKYTPLLPILPLIKNKEKSTSEKTFFILNKESVDGGFNDYLLTDDSSVGDLPKIPSTDEEYFNVGDTVLVFYMLSNPVVQAYIGESVVISEINISDDKTIEFVFDSYISHTHVDADYFYFLGFANYDSVSSIKKNFSYVNKGLKWR